jgi:hypothetical protein
LTGRKNQRNYNLIVFVTSQRETATSKEAIKQHAYKVSTQKMKDNDIFIIFLYIRIVQVTRRKKKITRRRIVEEKEEFRVYPFFISLKGTLCLFNIVHNQ